MKKQLNLVYIGLALLSVISCRSPKENDIEPDTTLIHQAAATLIADTPFSGLPARSSQEKT